MHPKIKQTKKIHQNPNIYKDLNNIFSMTHSSSQNLTVINADFKLPSRDVQKTICTYSKPIQWFRKKAF